MDFNLTVIDDVFNLSDEEKDSFIKELGKISNHPDLEKEIEEIVKNTGDSGASNNHQNSGSSAVTRNSGQTNAKNGNTEATTTTTDSQIIGSKVK